MTYICQINAIHNRMEQTELVFEKLSLSSSINRFNVRNIRFGGSKVMMGLSPLAYRTYITEV